MKVESALGHRDLMSVGLYLVTFDEAGADIEHESTRGGYRVQATTHLITAPELDQASRCYFNGLREARAESQVYGRQACH